MQFTTVTILSALSTLAVAQSHSPTQWHITDLQAGCRNEATSQECSYLFNIVGDKSDETPGFRAQCTARSLQGDNNLRGCTLVGGWGGKYNVDEVNAYVSQWLSDERGSDTHLEVEVKFNDGSNKKYVYTASKIQNYDEFVKTKNFDIYPIAQQSATK